jgi:hypothetical protein
VKIVGHLSKYLRNLFTEGATRWELTNSGRPSLLTDLIIAYGGKQSIQ